MDYNSKKGINYTHQETVSLLSKVLQVLMDIINSKQSIQKSFSTGKFNTISAPIPKYYFKRLEVRVQQVLGRDVYNIIPKEKTTDKVVFYIHGGAYISNIGKRHWSFIKQLTEDSRSTFVVPDYPLAPSATYADAYMMVEKVYEQVLTNALPENVIFMGDSAGAGLALGLAQKLKKENKPQPKQIILLSPWLDISMSNPNISFVEPKDKMLGKEGLLMAGKAYAGTLEMNNYLVSPIYGDFTSLGKISVFIGTNDLFIADVSKFKQMMHEQNIAFNYFEYPEMFHVWMAVTYLKEAQDAIKHIVNLINKS